jgi:ATP-binding cassette subfamily B protein
MEPTEPPSEPAAEEPGGVPGKVPAGEPTATTIYDLQGDPEGRVDMRRIPGLARRGVRILWDAGRRDLLVFTVLQAVGGAGIAVQLLLGQRALQALLEASRSGGSVRSVLPWAGAVATVAALLFFASAVQRERQQILGELVSRHVEERVLDVATAVELEAFETPAFHNRLQRIRSNMHQPLNLVYGLSGLASAAVGVVGVLIALLALQPVLIPLLVLVPAWLVASRRSEAFYRYSLAANLGLVGRTARARPHWPSFWLACTGPSAAASAGTAATSPPWTSAACAARWP